MSRSTLTAMLLCSAFTIALCQDTWQPTSLDRCRTNEDCHDDENLCCTYQPPIIGKRDSQGRALTPDDIQGMALTPDDIQGRALAPDGMFHLCSHWRNETSHYCSVQHPQYSPDATYYFGSCPCRPGLTCIPSGHLPSGHVAGKCRRVE